ncbi:nucleoside triphosphate pyrophosphohydrolase family protein [Labilibaculum sp. K2S]|uniref:nucleoside triphosphate pyrophosphohydrolase family protein n=1 Tax=Labilibaculum sp. K2S TaxID=3056386 RepID=UPI0025A39C1A|nr:nucleoside triphosphate pyrophosphohydrolase family protein [Labilibaculum sp. K2S]MDM8160463.1 nucleoside triphosphate pyrophosphohydrolase family protein [Labilibaculum sp. K2S]
MTALEKVNEFHKAFGVNVEKTPVIPAKERCELRQNIIQEEVDELKVAWESGNLVEVADALADIHYLIMGTVLEFGLQDKYAEIFSEVHRSNMSKLDENGNPIYREDGKVIKSELYSKPEIAKILTR